MDCKIRPAGESDRDAIVAIHIESWRDSYRGVLPDRFLGRDLPEVLRDRWAGTTFDGPDMTLVAVGDTCLGFIAVVAGEMPYIYNLHVTPTARGRGVGQRLLGVAADRLIWEGEIGVYLHVLTANLRTRALYRRLGGVEGTPFREDLFGQPVETVTVTWPNLPDLRDRIRDGVKR